MKFTAPENQSTWIDAKGAKYEKIPLKHDVRKACNMLISLEASNRDPEWAERLASAVNDPQAGARALVNRLKPIGTEVDEVQWSIILDAADYHVSLLERYVRAHND